MDKPKTLYDIDDNLICLVVLVTTGALDRNASTREVGDYYERVLGGCCDDCSAVQDCALGKRER